MPHRPRPKTLPHIIQVLKQKRLAKKLTRKQLASKLGYRADTIYHWETGVINPSYPSLVNWCQFFKLKLDVSKL